MNRYFLLILHTASLVLLYFGLTLNMLQIDVTTEFIFKFNLFNEKRSVIGTLQSLYESGNSFPFALILLFGILIPITKSGILYYLLLTKQQHKPLQKIVSGISKWAMADVFAISIFVAFLGANAMKNTKAILEQGFYYFTAYVILSTAIAMLVNSLKAKQD